MSDPRNKSIYDPSRATLILYHDQQNAIAECKGHPATIVYGWVLTGDRWLQLQGSTAAQVVAMLGDAHQYADEIEIEGRPGDIYSGIKGDPKTVIAECKRRHPGVIVRGWVREESVWTKIDGLTAAQVVAMLGDRHPREDDPITIKDALNLSGVSERTIRQAAQAGHISGAHKQGRDWVFSMSAFQQWNANRPKRGRPPSNK